MSAAHKATAMAPEALIPNPSPQGRPLDTMTSYPLPGSIWDITYSVTGADVSTPSIATRTLSSERSSRTASEPRDSLIPAPLEPLRSRSACPGSEGWKKHVI